MSDLPSYPELLGDARLAAHATSATPAWLWSTDGTRILWANTVGAAMFGSANPADLVHHRLDAHQGMATQMQRLAGTLAYGGGARLDKLRGIGSFGRALLCSCARLVVAGHTSAILVIALEPAGPKLSFAERVRRLVDAVAEPRSPAAAFAPSGDLIYASPGATEALGTPSLRRLGTEMAENRGVAEVDAGISLLRLGQDREAVWVATFARPALPMPPTGVATNASPDSAKQSLPAESPKASFPHEFHSEPAPHSPLAAGATTTSNVDADAQPVQQPRNETDATPASRSSEGPSLAPDLIAATPEAEAPDANADEAPPSTAAPPTERRHPLRFVWQMDSDERFTLVSEEFTEVIGPRMAVALGRPWLELARELALDPQDRISRAVSTQDTWSGINVSWPVEGSSDRLTVEMSGLPIFDRSRKFLGYRGFGVCRDVERINVLSQMRRTGRAHTSDASRQPRTDEHEAEPEPIPAESPAVKLSPDERPTLTLVPTAKNVVPFRGGAGEARAPGLSPVEHSAFRELARELTARLRDNGEAVGGREQEPIAKGDAAEPESAEGTIEPPAAANEARDLWTERADDTVADRPLLDGLPVGILAYRFDQLLYANRAFLGWTGHDDLEAFAEAGGLDSLLIDTAAEPDDARGRAVTITLPDDTRRSPGRLFTVSWAGESALALVVEDVDGTTRTAENASEAARRAEAAARELAFVVEAASDLVIVIDRAGLVLSANGRAQSLFVGEGGDLVGQSLFDLFAPESQRVVRHQFELLTRNENDRAVTDGREVAARVKANGHVALLMTVGRIGETGERFCAVLRDITTWKTQEHELVAAKLQAERASRAKSDFLAKVSHEIRTPLNSIIGFSDVMIEERFGPIGNERYREYLKDIRNSGEYVVSLLNDLLDLSKIEAGKLELNFVAVNLNEMIQACVMLMQPQANREHIIIRTALTASVKPVLADAKAARQIILNLLSNSIKFTGAGGQVIVSTALSDDGGVVVRVRDTGIGMSESDLAAALEPFRQLATAARWGSSGTGLGLPLTKALVESNRASFVITSKINEGTLVEITFPASRIVGA